MYTLYYSPGTASLAVHWMLIHLNTPFSLRLVDFAANAQKSPEYLAINPSGHVPALVVDGKPHAECAALLMLLAERHADAGLEPVPGTPERADYLLGNRLSAVDFLATMLTRWSRNMPKPATQFPHLLPYINQMRSLNSLQEVHAREGLTDWITPAAAV